MRIAAIVLSVVAVAGCAPSSRAQGPDSSFAALATLPDWSGVWLPDIEDQDAQIRTNPVPWNSTVAARIKQLEDQENAGQPKPLFANCLPEAMPSWMLISHNAMEILFTPGRVTMLGESDGNRLRRIYTDGRSHPADPDPSFHGHSIGHWEHDTLVVDTIGIFPETYIAVSEAVGVPNNGGLHVIERIHLRDANQLVDEMEIVAPRVMTAPWKTSRRYVRQRGAKFDIAEGVCLQGSFAESTDADGDAVFEPVPQAEGGNPAPLASTRK